MLDTKIIDEFAIRTIALAQQEVDRGGLPFSSLIVDENGNCISKGVNQVSELHDCTAHAEIQAIRAAGQKLGENSLIGCTLFASGEPCGLCHIAIRLAKISRVIVLLDRDEINEFGFDYLWTYQAANEQSPVYKTDALEDKQKKAPFLQYRRSLSFISL